jgi:hypothetical protein
MPQIWKKGKKNIRKVKNARNSWAFQRRLIVAPRRHFEFGTGLPPTAANEK